MVQGKRVKFMTRYNKKSKEEALKKILWGGSNASPLKTTAWEAMAGSDLLEVRKGPAIKKKFCPCAVFGVFLDFRQL